MKVIKVTGWIKMPNAGTGVRNPYLLCMPKIKNLTNGTVVDIIVEAYKTKEDAKIGRNPSDIYKKMSYIPEIMTLVQYDSKMNLVERYDGVNYYITVDGKEVVIEAEGAVTVNKHMMEVIPETSKETNSFNKFMDWVVTVVYQNILTWDEYQEDLNSNPPKMTIEIVDL